MKRKNGAADLSMGVLAGFVLGLAAGFLYAPYSGKEMRTKLKEKAQSGRDVSRELPLWEEPRAVKMVLVVNRGCIEPVRAA